MKFYWYLYLCGILIILMSVLEWLSSRLDHGATFLYVRVQRIFDAKLDPYAPPHIRANVRRVRR